MVLGGDLLSCPPSSRLILDMSSLRRPFEVLLRGGPPSIDLVDMGKEVVELQVGYLSKISLPFQ
jgi:hypothetical protein